MTETKSDDRPRAHLSLPSDQEILITRDLRARRTTVFDAWSRPEFVRRWYACDRLTMVVCDLDFKVGGRWRWVLHDPAAGQDHPMSGEYLEIVRPERIVYSERYEPVPASEHRVELTFAERDGVTTLQMRILHSSKLGRDMHLQAGMESGIQQSMDRLAAVVETLEASAAA